MEFKLSPLKKNSKTQEKTVPVPASLLHEISALLFKAECTAVYDPRNCEYIKLNDIPEDLSDRLETYIKLS
jgi:hypothetical protein